MGDLRKNFSSEEFACKCGCGLKFQVDEALLDLLQYVRDETGKPLNINSGCRCREYNSKLPGTAENSWHIPRDNLDDIPTLYASDVTYSDAALRTPENMLRLYCYFSNGKAKGLGMYTSWVHADTRPTKRVARWISAMPQ